MVGLCPTLKEHEDDDVRCQMLPSIVLFVSDADNELYAPSRWRLAR